MMKRRRFLAISAAFAASPALATLQTWQGRGLGAALSLRLVGVSAARAALVWQKVEGVIARIERSVSLHQNSELVRLNANGHLPYPGRDIADLAALTGKVHKATQGAFDPSVQALWQARATGGNSAVAAESVGWHRVTVTPTQIALPRGTALTFNGIAQGWAGDQVADLLRGMGFKDVLIDMGEVMALGAPRIGQPWRAMIASPEGVRLGEVALHDRALATSSPRGTLIGGGTPHILHPSLAPRWKTVAVSAESAALADALSTAFCLMPRAAIDAALAAFPTAKLEVLV